MDYSEALRSIGQALEGRAITAFELKRLPDMYLIQNAEQRLLPFLSKVRHRFRPGYAAGITEPLILNFADVERLSEAGRADRSRSGGLTDFRRLSTILRTLGAYIDSNGLELVGLQKRAVSITLFYRDRYGVHHQDDRTISSFYRSFLEMCSARAVK